MFQAVRELYDSTQEPELFSCDFEEALIKKFSANFPSTTVGGCLFHFAQNILRHVRGTGLQREYHSNATINLHVRMLVALAFVPPNDVVKIFEELEEYVDPSLEPILEYLEDNYIGRRHRSGRKSPRFPIAWWNVYERTLNEQPRTNNSAEAGHRRFSSELALSHPSIWHFIDTLRKTQKTRDIEYDHIEGGAAPNAKKPKYVRLDARVRTIVLDYSNRRPINYLRAISHNICRN